MQSNTTKILDLTAGRELDMLKETHAQFLATSSDVTYVHATKGKLRLGPRLRTQQNADPSIRSFMFVNAGGEPGQSCAMSSVQLL